MTDTELDEMLYQWDAPPAPAELRRRVQAGVQPQPRRWFAGLTTNGWRGLFTGVATAAVVFLLVVTLAFPKMLGPGPLPAGTPWTVDSELIRYADDGTSSVEMDMTSYKFNSNEVVLSRSVPGNPFMTELGRTLDVVGPALSRLTLPLVVDANTLAKLKKIQAAHPSIGFTSGCSLDCLTLEHYFFAKAPAGTGNSCIAGTIVGHETILNHPTEAVRERWTEHGRMTIWTAPDLDCFALKVTYEAQKPDGTFHLVRAKQAMKVTVNP